MVSWKAESFDVISSKSFLFMVGRSEQRVYPVRDWTQGWLLVFSSLSFHPWYTWPAQRSCNDTITVHLSSSCFSFHRVLSHACAQSALQCATLLSSRLCSIRYVEPDQRHVWVSALDMPRTKVLSNPWTAFALHRFCPIALPFYLRNFLSFHFLFFRSIRLLWTFAGDWLVKLTGKTS